MLSFFAKIILYILAFVLIKFRKAFGMDNSTFNQIVNFIMRSLIAISLIVASPEIRRKYFGELVGTKMTLNSKKSSRTQIENKVSPVVREPDPGSRHENHTTQNKSSDEDIKSQIFEETRF